MKNEIKKAIEQTVKVIPSFYFGMIKHDGIQEEIRVNLGIHFEVLTVGLGFHPVEVEAKDSAVCDVVAGQPDPCRVPRLQ